MSCTIMDRMIANAVRQIQEHEDARIIEAISNMTCCYDGDGTGICDRCGLPVAADGVCPVWEVSQIMDS
jgi:hypothetical protein